MNSQRRVSFYTLGCRLNQAETALIAEAFRQKGYTIAEHGVPVEVAVINTCSVTERADARCRNEIRKARRRSPDAVVCAVGCYAQVDTQAVAAIDGVDMIVGTDKKYGLAELVERRVCQLREKPVGCLSESASADEESASRTTCVHGEKEQILRFAQDDRLVSRPEVYVSRRPDMGDFNYPTAGYHPHSTRANIKIQDGCDFCCAFCLLPRIRGAARSRPMGDIIAEGHELARRGHKELVIAGVNIGAYRHENHTIADLARALSDIPGIERVRVSSIEPSTVGDDLLEWMATSPKACRHLHLPLQSGDDSVLSRMKRVYTTIGYAHLIEKAKSMMPDLGLGTDIIVGFPGETEREFKSSMRFVEEMPFSYLHVFSYSERPKTAAVYYGGKNSHEAVRERSDAMHEMADKKKRAFFEEHVGRKVEVLFETVDNDGWRKGFTGSYVRVGAEPSVVGENVISQVYIEDIKSDFCVARR